jgi:hypothetical protein
MIAIDEEDDGDCGEGTNSSPEYDHAENMDDNFEVELPKSNVNYIAVVPINR